MVYDKALMKNVRGTIGYFVITIIVFVIADKPCDERTTDFGSVCVCNSTYCDTIPAVIEDLAPGQYQFYSTSKLKLGFTSLVGEFSNNNSLSASATVTISDFGAEHHQKILGFGGAFTDSAGIQFLSLSESTRNSLLEAYFGEDGVQYSIGRVPIGGTDFSTRGYTYCDVKDESLDAFALQKEDYDYKIPFIKRALELRGRNNIKFFASAWTAPIWMKTNDKYNGFGKIQEKYLKLWAKYHLKFLETYKQSNITFWGLTTQNEPVDGLLGFVVPNNGFTFRDMKKWITEALGPAIKHSSFRDLKIILHDDQRILLPTFNLFVLSDSEVVKYADGIGVHWYSDKAVPASFLDFASSDEKKLFRLATEACTGFMALSGLEKPVVLGSWDRAEQYLSSIMEDLKYDFVGWVDWNLALDVEGGPNFVNNYVDSPIIVNKAADEFYKQPMFYALGHFSKFVVTDSVRIDATATGAGITSLAFVRPDGKLAVILRNSSGRKKTVKVNILNSIEVFTLEAHSINTLLYTP